MALSFTLFVCILIITIIYWLLTRTFDHWKKQNVPTVPHPLPLVGHMLSLITLKENVTTFAFNIYKNYNHSAIGFYFMQKPGIVIRDPELVKCVMNTNFSNFKNNWITLSEEADPVLSKNPFFANNYHVWKESRIRAISHLSSKNLKHVFVIVQDVCLKMTDYIGRKIDENNGTFECELKENFIKYTGEIVANSAFGIQGQSFESNPDKLAFTNIAKTIFEPTIINGLKQALTFYFPGITKYLKISFIDKCADAYFRENLKAIIKQRKEMKNTPNDFLQFCIESNSEEELDSIIADVIVFFADVYETSSTALASIFYYLSLNKKIQDKLREHIESTYNEENKTVTYESLKNLNYLDQVINESLRLMPPLGAFLKACSDDITLTGSDGLKCHFRSGDAVFISVLGLHHDSNHWTDPQVFNPDRFSPENQKNHHKNVFIPFGDGPRMCLGMRLGLMIVKLATVSILSKYSINFSPKTITPIELEPTSIITYAKGGLWGRFEKLH